MPPRFRLAEGFAAGAPRMLAFHQPAAAVLHRFGRDPAEAFVLAPGWLGLPQVVQGALWPGRRGVLSLLPNRRLAARAPMLLAAPLSCGVAPIAFLFGVIPAARCHDSCRGRECGPPAVRRKPGKPEVSARRLRAGRKQCQRSFFMAVGMMSPWAGAGLAWGLRADVALRVVFTIPPGASASRSASTARAAMLAAEFTRR